MDPGYTRIANSDSTPGLPAAHVDVMAIDLAPARKVDGVLGVFIGQDLVSDGVGVIPTLIAERARGHPELRRVAVRRAAVAPAGDGFYTFEGVRTITLVIAGTSAACVQHSWWPNGT